MNKQQVAFLRKTNSLDNTILMNTWQFREDYKNTHYFTGVRRWKKTRKRRQAKKAIHLKKSKSQKVKDFKSMHNMVVSMKRNGTRVARKNKGYSTKAPELSGQKEVTSKVSEIKSLMY